MRRIHRLLVCLALPGTAACATTVAGPPAVPAPEGRLEEVWDRPPGAPDVFLRAPKSITPVPHQEPLYIVDGVVQEGTPAGLMGYDIVDIQVLRSAAAIARFGDRADNGAIIITTRNAPVKARPGQARP